MANGFLVPFATGALTELQRQKQVSDEIAASVVDNVSKHVLGVEIPAERKLIKSQENLKNQYATTYGQKVADGMDAMGLFESGNEQGLFNAVRMRFGDKYSIDTIADKINKASDEDYGKLIQTSFIGSRKSALQDRGAYIDSVLKDTKNIKDLLVGEAPKGLARFIGEPLGRKDEATATARLTKALEGPSPQPAEPSDAASLLGLDSTTGIKFSDLNFDQRANLKSKARLEYNTTQERFGGTFKKEYQEGYDPKVHGPMGILNADAYAFENYFQNYYLPFTAEVEYDGTKPLGKKVTSEVVGKTTQLVEKAKKPKTKTMAGERFIPNIPDVMDIPDSSINFLNEPSVSLAQSSIDKARASGNESAVEAIKNQLRKDLGINNLSDLIN